VAKAIDVHNSCCYLYESLVAAGRASAVTCMSYWWLQEGRLDTVAPVHQ